MSSPFWRHTAVKLFPSVLPVLVPRSSFQLSEVTWAVERCCQERGCQDVATQKPGKAAVLYPLVPEEPGDVAGDTCPLLQSSCCCALPSPSVTEGVGEEACKVSANYNVLPFKGKTLTLEAATALVSPRVGRRGAGELVTHGSLNPTCSASKCCKNLACPSRSIWISR